MSSSNGLSLGELSRDRNSSELLKVKKGRPTSAEKKIHTAAELRSGKRKSVNYCSLRLDSYFLSYSLLVLRDKVKTNYSWKVDRNEVKRAGSRNRFLRRKDLWFEREGKKGKIGAPMLDRYPPSSKFIHSRISKHESEGNSENQGCNSYSINRRWRI